MTKDKDELLAELRTFKEDLRALKRELNQLAGATVSRLAPRKRAEAIATKWVESIRSPLEHRFMIDRIVIESMAEQMKRLHVLSRPNNLKSSYLSCIGEVLTGFDDRFILPVQQTADRTDSITSLTSLIPALGNASVSEYLTEAIECAQAGHHRAAIVMGWCAAIAKVRSKVTSLGFAILNNTARAMKAQTSGKYKNWNKEFNVTSEAELQAVFDTDLIAIVENMQLIDGNESQRLMTCFQYRNHSAHPGQAPIEQPHVVTFFVDITRIILSNSKFS